MRQVISLIALTLAFSLSSISQATVPAKFALHGIAAGTKLKDVTARFGKPTERIPFGDGWVAYVYKLKNHYLIVETAAGDAEEIVAVQIEGSKSSEGDGLFGVNLGDQVESALQKLGTPVEKRPSVDEKTNKPIPNSHVYQYATSSFEETNGEVSSLKIHFEAREAASSLLAPGSKIVPPELLNYTVERWKALASEKYACSDAKIVAAKEFRVTPKGVISERWLTSICGKERNFVPILSPDGSGHYLVGFGE